MQRVFFNQNQVYLITKNYSPAITLRFPAFAIHNTLIAEDAEEDHREESAYQRRYEPGHISGLIQKVIRTIDIAWGYRCSVPWYGYDNWD